MDGRVSDHREAGSTAKILRRVAAILFQERAGFSANGYGRRAGSGGGIMGRRRPPGAVRASRTDTRPTYADGPTGLPMAQGR